MQQKKTTKEEYQKCVNVVVEYIIQHLGEDIDLKSLARISNFSPFYFHFHHPIMSFKPKSDMEISFRNFHIAYIIML